MEKYTYEGTDFKVVFATDKWKIGLLKHSDRFSSFGILERHLNTDEIFVLLEGNATLYIKKENGIIEETKMEKCIVYNVPKNEWHHIVVSPDASVMVVEDRDTSKENTEKVII